MQAQAKGSRYIVGIAGGPGSGKSTLATLASARINALAGSSALSAMVSMDGFHYYKRQLDVMPDPKVGSAPRASPQPDARARAGCLATLCFSFMHGGTGRSSAVLWRQRPHACPTGSMQCSARAGHQPAPSDVQRPQPKGRLRAERGRVTNACTSACMHERRRRTHGGERTGPLTARALSSPWLRCAAPPAPQSCCPPLTMQWATPSKCVTGGKGGGSNS